MLDDDERSRLLALARDSIARGLGRAAPQPLPEGEWPSRLLAPTAAFVTLTLRGELRGCRGTTDPQRSLAEEAWRSAWLSAFADSRFPPVAPEEVAPLRIAVTVMACWPANSYRSCHASSSAAIRISPLPAARHDLAVMVGRAAA